MSPKTPRIPPLPEAEWDDEAREVLTPLARIGGGRVLNIFSTLARHPKLLRRWLVFANHVLGKSTLPARARELLILRTGWLCRSEYEWGQHLLIARALGLDEESIARTRVGPDAKGLSVQDALLLRAADELHQSARISDATWRALGAHFDTKQCMDLVFTVGQYHLVAMALNSFGVERDPGVPGFESHPDD